MLPEGKRPFGSTVIAQRGQESMRKRQRGTRPVSDEPLSAGRVEYLEQARERVRNQAAQHSLDLLRRHLTGLPLEES